MVGNESTGGQWNLSESMLHINELELKAIYFGLLSFFFFYNKTNIQIRIKSDNVTAVMYVNDLGGLKSLSCYEISKTSWLWKISKNNSLR